jgi:hypothetical protein
VIIGSLERGPLGRWSGSQIRDHGKGMTAAFFMA